MRRDVALLFASRIVRLFAYGSLSIVFVLYLVKVGLGGPSIALLLTLTLLGDAGLSLAITSQADRVGRRSMLRLGAALMAGAGVVFVLTSRVEVLMAAAIIGVISPSGSEIGPFLSIEQAALSQLVPDRRRTGVFAWYNLAGSGATALGALAGGWASRLLQQGGVAELASYRVLFIGYAVAGGVLALLFLFLSPAVEAPRADPALARASAFGLHRSRRTVAHLGALFALDAFAGGFILQSVLAHWFHLRFGANTATLGTLFFGGNLLAAVSALMAQRLAARFGLIHTMVFTHLPSNVLLMLVPFMPNLPLAAGVLLVRFSISQMDVPTRQSYTMAVVDPDERAAASGVTMIARSLGAAMAPVVGGSFLLAGGAMPFLAAGGLKIAYDLLLFRSFRRLRPPEESAKR